MPDERRFNEEEVAEIFEAAADPAREPGSALARSDGLTLAELQAIGAEVGLPPERIARAAAALDVRREATRVIRLGMPVSVRRTVDLPRAPSDREWEMLVAELRATFNARGRESSRGEVREWSNGNLHAYVEPTEAGHRLRMGTTKGEAEPLNRFGAFSLVLALVTAILIVMGGRIDEDFVIPVMLALMGSLSLATNAIRLPSWAGERERQMEQIGERAVALLSAGPTAQD